MTIQRLARQGNTSGEDSGAPNGWRRLEGWAARPRVSGRPADGRCRGLANEGWSETAGRIRRP
jgi:hypothetical protein